MGDVAEDDKVKLPVWTKTESSLCKSKGYFLGSIRTLLGFLWVVPQSSLLFMKAAKNGMIPFDFVLPPHSHFFREHFPRALQSSFLTGYSFETIWYPAGHSGLNLWCNPLAVCLQGPFLVFLSLWALQSHPCLPATWHSRTLPVAFRSKDFCLFRNAHHLCMLPQKILNWEFLVSIPVCNPTAYHKTERKKIMWW